MSLPHSTDGVALGIPEDAMRRLADSARTAVPRATNSRLLPSIRSTRNRTPTTPSAPIPRASSTIRAIAVR